MSEDLARRSINSVKWNFVSNIVYNAIYFVQTIILARLLPVEAFGVYAGAAAIVVMTNGFASFGLGGAFIHRAKETADVERAAAVHFTLQCIINSIWTVLVLAGGLLLLDRTEPGLLLAYVVLTLSFTVKNSTQTPQVILNRQVRHQRFALLQFLDAIVTFLSAILLAILHQPIWALLATNISTAILSVIVFYLWRPLWRPKFLWDAGIVKYFFRFGVFQAVGGILLDFLDRGDDFWIKTYLGSVSLGFYSRAYAIAKIPGNIIGAPMTQVAKSTYAELKGDKKVLSEAFYESNSFLILTGFLAVGGLALVAPEFIRIAIGEKWMPMLLTFRLMLPFTMFDPMKQVMASLFIAIGKPETIVKIRIIQLLVMVISLFVFGLPFGIEGVAIAVDLMLVVGIALFLINARRHIDVPIRKMFLIPTIALFLGMSAGFLSGIVFHVERNDWLSGIIKGVVYLTVFLLIILTFEQGQVRRLIKLWRKYIPKKPD